jgi:hypothetical protein
MRGSRSLGRHNLKHPRCKRGGVVELWGDFGNGNLFIALQTQISGIRVANADELWSIDDDNKLSLEKCASNLVIEYRELFAIET